MQIQAAQEVEITLSLSWTFWVLGKLQFLVNLPGWWVKYFD
jgi:hypothetical protein